MLCTEIEWFLHRMRTVVLLLALVAAPALAGTCREQLRPLLLDPAADPVATERVRRDCQRQADAGDADALYQLALTELGLAGRWEPQAAIPKILDAATHGVAEAQYWLAWQYESGALLPADAASALAWYQRAAAAGHRLALSRMVQAYDRGELGLARDAAQAVRYRALQSQCAQQAGSKS